MEKQDRNTSSLLITPLSPAPETPTGIEGKCTLSRASWMRGCGFPGRGLSCLGLASGCSYYWGQFPLLSYVNIVCPPTAAGTDPAPKPPPTRVSVDGFSCSVHHLDVDFFSSSAWVEALLVRGPHAHWTHTGCQAEQVAGLLWPQRLGRAGVMSVGVARQFPPLSHPWNSNKRWIKWPSALQENVLKCLRYKGGLMCGILLKLVLFIMSAVFFQITYRWLMIKNRPLWYLGWEIVSCRAFILLGGSRVSHSRLVCLWVFGACREVLQWGQWRPCVCVLPTNIHKQPSGLL